MAEWSRKDVSLSKRRYQAHKIQDLNVERLRQQCNGGRAIIGVDVAKNMQFAAVFDADRGFKSIFKWQHPDQTQKFVDLCRELRTEEVGVEVAMEPSGTYGDPIRFRLLAAGIPVFRVAPKRVHDSAEVFDGVPSLHDAKAAYLIGKLHLEGATEVWPLPDEKQRELRAATDRTEMYEKSYQQHLGRLEAQLARHWPELSHEISLDRASTLSLLAEFGSPQAVALKPERAAETMRKSSRGLLSESVIESVVRSAAGQPVEMTPNEVALLRAIVGEAQRMRTSAADAKRELSTLLSGEKSVSLVQTAGVLLAAALLCRGCDQLPNAGALEKAAGLNLKVFSSGKKKGGLHITKRGDGRLRQLLYMFAMRMVQRDAVVKAWYVRKVERQGGHAKVKALVALTRKLVRGLWHVARGEQFDSTKLFDVRRLGLDAEAA